MEKYLEQLPENISLRIYDDDTLLFESNGKWLHPLFDAEKFLIEKKLFSASSGLKQGHFLTSHDSAIGKAAAVLTARLGVKKIHANLLSQKALDYINDLNSSLPEAEKISVTYDNLVPRLMCATEDQLSDLTDSDQMYFLLRQRAKLVQGIDVSVKNLTYDFGSIKNLSFELKSGGHLMILGENGAGKTTLLRLLTGMYKPASGEILIGGKAPKNLEKFTIGYIPQSADNTQFSLSVEEVIALGIKAKGMERRQIIQRVLKRTSSENLAGRSYNTLSGGEKQKINLARCLAQNAKLLLLDEPTAALDAENRKMVTDILRSLTISEIPSIIVVTHDEELTKMRGWEILRLNDEKNIAGGNL